MSGGIGAFRARTLGLIGGKRRRRMFLGALAPIAVLGAVLLSNAFAVQDVGLFELDRNAVDSDAQDAKDDWDTLFNDTTDPFGHSVLFTGILPDDEAAPSPDQFAGGGSKDNNDISEWRWKVGEPLDKDDITNAYSAGYIIPQGAPGVGMTGDSNKVGDFVAYFGLDRFATDGDAQVGFWFTQQNVAETNVKKNGAFTFSGNHVNGDVLVQSNFTNGGVVDNVTVYEWDSSVSGNLRQLASGGDCQAGLTNALACATVNRQSEASPWTYIPKGASADSDFPQGGFYEGGINLSRLARRPNAPATGCLSTFIAETRSSQQFDAVLKDLDLGSFDTCDNTITTESNPKLGNGTDPGDTVVPGSSVSDKAIITGTSLVGGNPARPTGEVRFFLCQPSQVTAAGCPSGSGTEVTPKDTTLVDYTTTSATNDSLAESNTTTNTTTVGKYCWRAEYTPDAPSTLLGYSAKTHTNDTTECFRVVAQATTTTTRQFVYPQDRAKITAPTATGDLDGDVYFRLFDTETNCKADDETANATGLKYASGAIAVDGASGQERKTNNTTYAIDSSKTTTHFWHVIYDADPGSPGSTTDRGNSSQLDSESDCVETTAVTFAGDDGSITVPGSANP